MWNGWKGLSVISADLKLNIPTDESHHDTDGKFSKLLMLKSYSILTPQHWNNKVSTEKVEGKVCWCTLVFRDDGTIKVITVMEFQACNTMKIQLCLYLIPLVP